MGDLRQQIADGARPLARVGDVIAHGEAIPANVVRMSDVQSDVLDPPTAFWIRRAPGLYAWRGHAESRWLLTDSDLAWWPMTVVEVDPGPPPACWKCRGADGRIVDRGAGSYADGRLRFMHAYGSCESNGEVTEEVAEMFGLEWPRPKSQSAAEVLDLEPPAESDPVVLSLPQVPDGAVALVTEDGTRFVPHGNQGGHSWWHSDSRGTFSLARILSELGSVTVEFAPPREARVWEQLDPGTDDLQVVECLGMRYTRGSDSLWHGDRTSRTWLQLRALGEVREVLT